MPSFTEVSHSLGPNCHGQIHNTCHRHFNVHSHSRDTESPGGFFRTGIQERQVLFKVVALTHRRRELMLSQLWRESQKHPQAAAPQHRL